MSRSRHHAETDSEIRCESCLIRDRIPQTNAPGPAPREHRRVHDVSSIDAVRAIPPRYRYAFMARVEIRVAVTCAFPKDIDGTPVRSREARFQAER